MPHPKTLYLEIRYCRILFLLIQTSFSSIRDVFSKVREGKSEVEVLQEKKRNGGDLEMRKSRVLVSVSAMGVAAPIDF